MDHRWKRLRAQIVLSDFIWIALFGWLAMEGSSAWWLAVLVTVLGWFVPSKYREIPLFKWESKK